ncbi:Sterol 3-beta-glucosyltransferase [Hypsizygus marmoreus]|uniref:sterol 3beta-glucosyltransferase n=1 Tax=Hypsizygus marmoreus TaxID=39966 RepID=A0A369JBT5_HYPMA|nr:Sterol 3-beta-glucosyltransferase [Hypsizygus marmoreus]
MAASQPAEAPNNRRLSRASSLSDDVEKLIHDPDPPTISSLYSEAAEFEKMLAVSGCIDIRCSEKDGANGFADLIARDLNSSEQALADSVARLSATQDSWSRISDESETSEEVSEEVSEEPYPALATTPIIHRVEIEEDDSWKLEPDEVIALLIEEFGPLAAEDDEEKLILEADGCLIHDVFIVGVIHVTTHRLAFHASLLASQPDLPPAKRVIKSGPATLHRGTFLTKRRVWMELSHDMVCAYASSKDEGRIRPLCTILLAFVNKVLPFDPKKPRHIRIQIGHSSDQIIDACEFDTEESAQDWRRELTGALFLYRHRRREALEASIPDDQAGVRLSCPLNRISCVRFRAYADFPDIASLRVQPALSDDSSIEEGITEAQTIHLGTVRPTRIWAHLNEYIAAATHRLEKRPKDQFPIFIDFGPLTFHETPNSLEGDMSSLKEKTIRGALSLDAGESELWITRARIYHSISSSGYLVVSQHFVCFWSKSFSPGDVKYRIPVLKLQSVKPFHLSFCRYHGITLEIKGKPALRLIFQALNMRNEALERVSTVLKSSILKISASDSSDLSTASSTSRSSTLSSASIGLVSPKRSATGIFAPLSRSLAAAMSLGIPPELQLTFPKVINLPREVLARMAPLHFVCLTIGSRGDVQPYIALGLALKKEGHSVTIVSHEEYKDWIEGFDIRHRTAGGDPGALMKLSVDNRMFSAEFFRKSLGSFRPWLDQLLLDSWEACKDADVLLESPSAMAGVHIAEALNIPYFRTFTMPWTKTADFPHPFLSPPVDSPTFNSASYVLFNNVIWTATSGQINKWRRRTLKINNTDMGHLAQSKIITIYNFSPAVVPKPLDWGDTTIISGYWFLDNPDHNWIPPPDLLKWMKKARDDGKPIVYIGFGSITVPHPDRVTARIIKAVVQSDVRAIISKGWSSRMHKPDLSVEDAEGGYPPQCYMLEKIPHDWLFPRIDAALHHGGAGTTGASLRAGIPTLIKPWFGDQFFWGCRVQKLGAGLRVPSLRVSDIADALTKATTSVAMREKAAAVGAEIRGEDGVHTAIHTIYTYLPRASRDRTSLSR